MRLSRRQNGRATRGGGGEEAEGRSSEKDLHLSSRREGSSSNSSRGRVVANGAEVSERVCRSGRAEYNAGSQQRRDGEDGHHRHHHASGKDTTSDLDRDRYYSSSQFESRVPGRRFFSERDEEEEEEPLWPEWGRRRSESDWYYRESESYYRRGDHDPDHNGGNGGGMGVEGVSERDEFPESFQGYENMNHSGSGTPVRGRHHNRDHNRDKENSMDRHYGWGSREGSVDRASDRNGYRNGRAGVKVEYWLNDGGFDNRAEGSDFRFGDRVCGELLAWRNAVGGLQAHPGQSQYRPGTYLTICNARYNQLRGRSPAAGFSPRSSHGGVPLDPSVSPPRYLEEGYNDASQSQGKGWTHHGSRRPVQGSHVDHSVEEGLDFPQLRSDRVVHREGSHDRVTQAHARSLHDSKFSSMLEKIEQSAMRSPRPPEVSLQLFAPSGKELSPVGQNCKIENAERDICPSVTGLHLAGSADEDWVDYHIDERVEKLMEGRILIPGKEKEIVHEALSIASQRVQQEYESDIAIEESPRSHGGFAEIGDQWNGDFGSDVQGLEGFFDQQVAKVETKAEGAVVGAGSEGGTEVASAPEPTPRASGAGPQHSESKNHHRSSHQESWKWPSRGGDWKVCHVPDSSHHSKGEGHTQGTSEKGYSGNARKVVMNGGQALCETVRYWNLRDPRRHFQESVKANPPGPMKLQLPKFALRPGLFKVDTSAEDQNVIHAQHTATNLKGGMTPKSQGSTPRAHLSIPVKDRFVITGGSKLHKSGKDNSTPGTVAGTATKSLGQAKQQQQQKPLSKGSKVGTPAIKRELSGAVKNSSVTDKRGTPRSVPSIVDVQLKSSSDHVVDNIDKKRKLSLPDGSLEKTPSSTPRAQASDLELGKGGSATPLKKLFLNRSLIKEELDLERHDFVSKSEAKELSVVTSLGVPVSPALSVLTPAALNSAPSTMSHLSATEESHSKGFTAEDSPKHEKRLLDVHFTEQASCSVYETLGDNGARMMDVEVEFCDRLPSTQRDVTFVDGRSFVLKRKASSVQDGESFKQRHRNMQKRRFVGNGDSEVDKKAAHSSPVTHVHSSMSPLIEVPVKALEVDPLEGQDQVEQKAQEPNWALLKSNILYIVFRSLRGDLKSLVNAMATCKSWMAAGQKYKTMLKKADLSSVHEQCLDAVLESLPAFGAGKLRRIVLKGCNVSPDSLGHLLRACPSISAVEIGYDEQFKDLICKFPHVKWLGHQNGGQSHKEGLTCKREAKHLKTKSLQVLGVSHRLRDSFSRDGGESEMHPVSDSASKARSPNGFTCLVSNVTVEETEMNDSYQDSAVTHFTDAASDGVNPLKLNNGGTIVKSNGVNGSMRAVKQENGNNMARLPVLKQKAPSGLLRRKHDKASHRMLKPVMGAHHQRLLADKRSSSSVKVEHRSKSTIVHSSLFEGDRTLEKEMRLILRVIMQADSNKCFQPANLVATDGKGVSSLSARAPDLLVIERKLRAGAYAGGKDGFKAFKDDVNCLMRIGFRNAHDKLMYSAAEKIFKLAHQQFTSLENQIAGTLPTDSNNQGKLPGSRPSSKAGKGGLKNDSILHHRRRKKRKVWDDDGVHKGGKFGVAKKGRHGESSSGDVDSDSDSTEHETRKVPKLKKAEQSWEFEGDSSDEDEEPTFMEEDEEETETEASDSDVLSESEGEDGAFEDENYDTDDTQVGFHDWGARMTKAAMVPPVTRKYVVIEEYRIVADKERVEEKMKVELPEDYEEKQQAAKDKLSDSYSHLDIPETRDYRPRKKLGEEVLEQEVYGIDPYTHNLLWDSMPRDGFSDSLKQQFIEERLLLALNREGKQFTGSGKAPMELNLERVVERITMEADVDKDWALHDFSELLLTNMRNRTKEKFVAYRKGLGVVCNTDNGLEKDEFVVEFFGEVYPPWRWYEKQDGIRSLQKKDKDTTPEFYNIMYERPKGDAAGYDILVVDAMHKANFASRLCHSCRPNCEAKITAVNNAYIIGVYALKPIKRGEELTFDYNSVTESKEEYNNAVCLCGSQGCKGSYLNLTGAGTFEEVIRKHHGLLDRHRSLLDSCCATSVSDEAMKEMRQAGLGTSLLSGLPPWVLQYAASLVHFMNIEKTLLPAELLKGWDVKMKKGMMEGATEENAEITTEGVYSQRLQNLATTLDKVRHILTKIYKNPGSAPPPLRKLDKREMVQWIWKREDSVVSELLQCLAPHLPKETLSDLQQSISKHSPHDLGTNLMQSLLWLRDELRRLSATCKARHDAAADLIHIYAYTKTFFVMEDYAVVESTPMTILPLDLGSSRHSISGPRPWHKTYSKEHVWGQLIGWYKQTPDPGAGLAKAGRGCLTLPDVSSCYAKSMQHDFRQGYGQRHREKMICYMEEKPQQKWPTSKFWSQFWSFKNERGLFGSPMLDSVLQDKPLDDQMVEWLKSRENVFVGPWDEQ